MILCGATTSQYIPVEPQLHWCPCQCNLNLNFHELLCQDTHKKKPSSRETGDLRLLVFFRKNHFGDLPKFWKREKSGQFELPKNSLNVFPEMFHHIFHHVPWCVSSCFSRFHLYHGGTESSNGTRSCSRIVAFAQDSDLQLLARIPLNRSRDIVSISSQRLPSSSHSHSLPWILARQTCQLS